MTRSVKFPDRPGGKRAGSEHTGCSASEPIRSLEIDKMRVPTQWSGGEGRSHRGGEEADSRGGLSGVAGVTRVESDVETTQDTLPRGGTVLPTNLRGGKPNPWSGAERETEGPMGSGDPGAAKRQGSDGALLHQCF